MYIYVYIDTQIDRYIHRQIDTCMYICMLMMMMMMIIRMKHYDGDDGRRVGRPGALTASPHRRTTVRYLPPQPSTLNPEIQALNPKP